MTFEGKNKGCNQQINDKIAKTNPFTTYTFPCNTKLPPCMPCCYWPTLSSLGLLFLLGQLEASRGTRATLGVTNDFGINTLAERETETTIHGGGVGKLVLCQDVLENSCPG